MGISLATLIFSKQGTSGFNILDIHYKRNDRSLFGIIFFVQPDFIEIIFDVLYMSFGVKFKKELY